LEAMPDDFETRSTIIDERRTRREPHEVQAGTMRV
jgi:hypothetical protein